MNYAAIDIGTNSVRLLVAAYEDGQFRPLCREMATTRLGAGLPATGMLSATGRKATLDAVCLFLHTARLYGVESTVAFATSAMREARDGEAFRQQLAEQSGAEVRVISAATEAAWSYAGAAESLPGMGHMLVFDLGGGSCELSWRQDGKQIFRSLKIGAVYVTDAWLHHDPPLDNEVERARNFIGEQLRFANPPSLPLVGVGGTITSLAAMAMSLKVYDYQRIHGYLLHHRTVSRLLREMLIADTRKRQEMPGLQKERAAILPAGAMVVDLLMDVCGQDRLTVSEGDILLGCLYTLADQHQTGTQG
jgi:exopolyphosphatase / guanosine-5'-triphosphate,3'-diphosphate pyrophosphatase